VLGRSTDGKIAVVAYSVQNQDATTALLVFTLEKYDFYASFLTSSFNLCRFNYSVIHSNKRR